MTRSSRCLAPAITLAAVLVLAPSARGQSAVLRWNSAMLDAIAANPPAPTLVTWRMHLVTNAMYDAWAAYDAVALGTRYGDLLRRPAVEQSEANKLAALSYAAYRSLSYVYPNQEPDFAALLTDLGFPLSGSRDPSTPDGIGNLMADAAIASRLADGANAPGGFAQITSATFPTLYEPVNSPDPDAPNAPGGATYDPNRWQPLRVPTGTRTDDDGNPIVVDDDPASYRDQRFLSPHWGAVRPFALSSGSQFLPPAPPQLGSAEPYVDVLGNVSTNDQAFRDQSMEILETSAQLDDRQKVIAEFWADGPRTWTPPGHWNQLAQGLSMRDQHSLDDDVKMYFALNGALHDAAIAAWDAKRRYDFVRPISAIRDLFFGQQIAAWGGPNQGTQMIPGETWQPYQALDFVTPPFAEYVSGHSTFSRSSREVLLAFTGSDLLYDGVTTIGEDYDGDGVEDLLGQHVVVPGNLMFENGPAEAIVLQWPTMLEASDEAGFSRRYGGIHFQDGDLWGRDMGRQIGQQAYARAEAWWSGIDQGANQGVCVADATTLCIGDRWQVQASYRTAQGGGSAGLGRAVPLTEVGVDRGGLITFFNTKNPELLVKVLDGCANNGHHWVLLAAATNVGYTVTVRDVLDGSTWSTGNRDGTLAPAVIDTEAQPCG